MPSPKLNCLIGRKQFTRAPFCLCSVLTCSAPDCVVGMFVYLSHPFCGRPDPRSAPGVPSELFGAAARSSIAGGVRVARPTGVPQWSAPRVCPAGVPPRGARHPTGLAVFEPAGGHTLQKALAYICGVISRSRWKRSRGVLSNVIAERAPPQILYSSNPRYVCVVAALQVIFVRLKLRRIPRGAQK